MKFGVSILVFLFGGFPVKIWSFYCGVFIWRFFSEIWSFYFEVSIWRFSSEIWSFYLEVFQ